MTTSQLTVEMEQQRYRALLDFIPDGYLATTSQGIIQEANLAAVSLLHTYQQGDLVGKSILDFMAPENQQDFPILMTRLAQAERIDNWKIDLQLQDGASFPVTLTIAAILEAEGKLAGLHWLLRSNAEPERLEARLLAEMLSVLASNRALVSEIEVDNLLEFIMAQAQHFMNAQGAAVLLLSNDEQQLEVATPGKLWLHLKPGSILPVEGSLAEMAITNQKVQISNLALTDDRTSSIRALLQPYYRVQALLCAPLRVQGKNLGVLLVWSEREQNFNEQDSRLMGLFADQAALALHNAHLHLLNRQLAVEQERQRLARDLHDSVTQSLYSIRLAAQASLRLLPPDIDSQPRQAIEHIQLLSQTVLIDIRKRIYDLHPTNQTAEGLVRALAHYCDVLRDQYSLIIDFMTGPEPPLSIYQREILYGIAKEALWNVVKHAAATHVNIVLTRENEEIVLSIRDNGVGFDPLFIRTEAMGLRSMEERAKLLAGNFELQTKPGHGTQLMIRITIPHA